MKDNTQQHAEQSLSENGSMVDDPKEILSILLNLSILGPSSSTHHLMDLNGSPQQTVLQIAPRNKKRGLNRMGPKDDMSTYHRAAKNIKVNSVVKYTPHHPSVKPPNPNSKVQGTKTNKK